MHLCFIKDMKHFGPPLLKLARFKIASLYTVYLHHDKMVSTKTQKNITKHEVNKDAIGECLYVHLK